ncbi:MAG: hypothetical protein HXS44_16550 [Theionarchaea archaeon]|nr:hypothetical protein [Theionarchaea archaeon]
METDANAAVIPTIRDHLEPSHNWLSTSLPKKSVPNGCLVEGSWILVIIIKNARTGSLQQG